MLEPVASNAVTPAAPATYTVFTNAGINGSINPTAQTVTPTNVTSFTITPNASYSAFASGCGGSLAGSTYTTGIITANCTVSVTFTLTNTLTQKNLVTGWNLLGNGVNAPLDVVAILGDVSKVSTVWKWMPATKKWAFYAPSMSSVELANYAAGKGYDVLSAINGGEGFWVNAKAAFTASLPTGTAVTTVSLRDQADPTQSKLRAG